MCFELLAIAASIAGSFMTAQAQANNAAVQAKIQKTQLKVEIENEKIKMMQQTNDRMEQYMREEATNRAALSASGLQNNISYDQAIAPYNKKVVKKDIMRSDFEGGQKVGNSRYRIKVASAEAAMTANSAYTTAFADSIGAIGSALV